MIKKQIISGFEPVTQALDEPVERFGGQPHWIHDPEWPWSEAWNRPMQFICQLPLYRLDHAFQGRVAYLFATHASHDEREEFFDPDVIFPDAGENAVIIQPHGTPTVVTTPDATGPSLYGPNGFPCSFLPTLQAAEDPEFENHESYLALSESERSEYFAMVQGNKIGGVPGFFQGDDWPQPGEWHLLLQLETSQHLTPFILNLGASPVLFAFVSVDGTSGRMLVQDS